MGNHGIAISQKGHDVNTCADRFLAYSSAFQGLKVFSKTTIQIQGEDVGTITHNLGYYAPFIVFDSDGAVYDESYGAVQNSTTALTIDLEDADPDTTYTFYVFIFADDFSTIVGRVVNTDITEVSSSDDWGMRISKDGYDVKNCTDDQLIFSSSFFTNIIHSKGSFVPGPDNGYGASDTPGSVEHNLGYVPDYLLYKKEDGQSYITMWRSYQDFKVSKISSTTLTAGEMIDLDLEWYSLMQTFYYIIFKNKVY